MTEKNTITLIIVAVIGAFGAILAACIGLIPTVLPIVRPSPTVQAFITDTTTPSATFAPETPSVTLTLTDFPTTTATLTPITETPTMTFTSSAQTTNIDAYEGIWVNNDADPSSAKVGLIPTRLEITKTGDLTADISACRATEDGQQYVVPNPIPGVMYAFGLAARDIMAPGLDDLRWAIIVQRVDEELIVTIQEYDINNTLLNSDTFNLQKPNLLESVGLEPCEDIAATPTP